VTNHVSDLVVGGGAQVLILLAGYNLARYQRKRLFEGRGIEVLTSFVVRVILPYYVLLIAYLIAKRKLDIAALLMVSNFFGRHGTMVEPFWFLEALLQCMVVVVLLMAVPPMRRFAARDSWSFGLGLLAVSVAVKVADTMTFGGERLLDRTVDAVFYMLAFGWCVQQANTRPRRLLVSAIAATFAAMEFSHVSAWSWLPWPSNLGHAIWLLVASLLIVWLPRIQIPRILHKLVTTIAAASFYIYLTHVLPVEAIYWRLHLTNLLLNLGAAVALGILVWMGFQRFDPSRLSWLRRAKPTA
jgi:surface polysaccharide O-acyltransferase-like enzyme